MPEVSGVQPELLSAALDRLLPAHEELPPAGQMRLADAVINDASKSSTLAEALTNVMQGLPIGFCELEGRAQDRALQAAEAAEPDAFSGLINLAYTAYYTDPRVLDFIARRSAYRPGPPQPRGYTLAPFDERLIEQVRKRGPLWRSAG